MKRFPLILIALVAVNLLGAAALAEDGADQGLAEAAQNPLASMISLPLQNNTTFGGMDGDVLNTLNIQPVYPVTLSADWNLITRTILPVVSGPYGVDGGQESGLGDATFTGWFSPDKPVNNITWGVGPVAYIPTATKSSLGAGQWGGGASAVGVFIKKKWVAGALVNNIWGFSDTDELNVFLLQYFVNYNLSKGWYLVSGPIITANWNAPSSDRWVVPFGGGAGKIVKIGKLPVNINAHIYYNVEKPDSYGDYTARIQFQFMFPR